MNYIMIGVLLAAAILLAVYGLKTLKDQKEIGGKVWVAVSALFFVGSLLHLAFRLVVSPLP